MRSGTNFLIHSMYQNFYKNTGILMPSKRPGKHNSNVFKYYQSFDPDNQSGAKDSHDKYMALFGSHKEYNKQKCFAKKSIYVVRNPYDCMHSLYVLETSKDSMSWYSNRDKNISYEKWLVSKNIPKLWKEHVTGYVNSGIMIIRYEDLKNNYENEINRIKHAFNLQLVSDRIIKIDRKVGWSAQKDDRSLVSPENKHKQSIKDIVRKEIPKGFMNYEI